MPSVLLATAGYDHKVRLWEASTGTCNQQLNFADSQVNCLEISPNKQYIAAAGNPHTRVYDVIKGGNDPLKSLDGHTHNVTAVGFQKDTKWMYSGSEDGTLRIWDLRKPVIAQVHGYALAGGSELAAACDLVYVAEDAQIGYPVVRVISPPDMQFHPWLVGMRQAIESLIPSTKKASVMWNDKLVQIDGLTVARYCSETSTMQLSASQLRQAGVTASKAMIMEKFEQNSSTSASDIKDWS